MDKELIESAPMGREIVNECETIAELLLKKNTTYGNSALDPIGIFSGISAEEQLAVRIDDKLNRIAKGSKYEYVEEDTVLDLIGYLILYRIAQKRMCPN